VLSSRSGDVRGECWPVGERARARNNEVVELGDPKTIEGAGGELDKATGKLDWGRVLGADIAREMGISALRTGDGSRPAKDCNRVRPPSGGGVGTSELLDGGVGVGVGDGDCEFGLRGEGVRGEVRSREPLAGVLVLLSEEGRGAGIIIPEVGEDDERNG
jgi:hypothetical protein